MAVLQARSCDYLSQNDQKTGMLVALILCAIALSYLHSLLPHRSYKDCLCLSCASLPIQPSPLSPAGVYKCTCFYRGPEISEHSGKYLWIQWKLCKVYLGRLQILSL